MALRIICCRRRNRHNEWGQGSDQISAESGVDGIYQRPINSTEPDGSKDAIICGDGKNEIWIIFSIVGDQVSDDCEIIHKG
jgi:hypothetical protein